MLYRLMVVEDEERIRKGIVHAIDWSSMGFEVVAEAINGRDALQKFSQSDPDVILTDVRMPVMDGLELVQRIKSENERVRFVILSGYSDFDTVRTALRSQVDDYLLKPTDKKSLIQTFNQLRAKLDQQQLDYQAYEQQQALMIEGLRTIRQQYLLSLIQGDIHDTGQIEDRMNALEISLAGDTFVVAVLSFKKDPLEKPDQSLENELLNRPVFDSLSEKADAINQVIQEKEMGIAFMNLSNQIVLILSGSHAEMNPSFVHEYLQTLIQHLMTRDPSWRSAYGGIGHFYPTLSQLSQSYRAAFCAMERHFFDDRNPLAIADQGSDPDTTVQKWLNEYPYEINEIVGKVVAGHSEVVGQMINHVFNNFRSKNMSPHFVKDYCSGFIFLTI